MNISTQQKEAKNEIETRVGICKLYPYYIGSVFKLEFTFIETLDNESYAIDIINVIKMETVRLDDTFVIMF